MSNFKVATKDDVKNAGFVFVKDVNTQEVKKIATSADFQVGLSNLPKDLTVTGKATFTQGLSGSLTRLTDGTSYLVAGNNVTITSASNGQITITGATLAPVDATYVVFSSNSTLTSERIITAGSGITITDGGAGGNLTIAATGGGSGDVVGPASATDNAVVRFDLTTGKLIQNSVVTIADTTGNITTPGDIAINGGDLTTTAATMNLVNDATTINLGSTAITRAINIGTNATNVQTINIGTGAAANIISIGSATGAASLTLQSGTGGINVGTSNVARTINIGSDPAGTATTMQTINIGAKNTSGFNMLHLVDEDSSTGHEIYILSDNGTQTGGTSVVEIGTVAAATTIDIGNSTVGAKVVTIGGTGGASSLALQAGTGNIALSGGNSTTYTIGTSSTTGTITIGLSTGTNTINIGNGATASTKTQTINVGNSTASGGITNINIGAASNGTNTITIGKFGGGLVNVILGGDDVQIGDSVDSDVGFFGTTPQPKTSVTDITNSVTSGGTANTLSNYTSLTVYSTDAAAIRGNFYQIGLKLNAIIDALQSYGLI